MCGSIVTAPFDVVKTRLQSDLFKPRSPVPLLSGVTPVLAQPSTGGLRALLWNFVDTGLILRDVYRYEGPTALFKGLGPTLVGVIPGRSINFFVYGNGKRIMADELNNGQENAAVHLGAAAVAGIITATATNPIWVVKTRMQLQQSDRSNQTKKVVSGTPLSKGPPATLFSQSYRTITTPASVPIPSSSYHPTSYSTTMNILRHEGIKGFYRGLSASLLGVTEGTIQWGLYEQFKIIAREGMAEGEEGGWRVSAAAGSAKLVATMITYPHEVIRTRLRQPPPPNSLPRYTALVQSFKLILLEEGWRALYGGLSPHLLRVVPNAVTMFWVYEKVLQRFQRDEVSEDVRTD